MSKSKSKSTSKSKSKSTTCGGASEGFRDMLSVPFSHKAVDKKVDTWVKYDYTMFYYYKDCPQIIIASLEDVKINMAKEEKYGNRNQN